MPWSVEANPKPIICRPALPMDTREVIELTRYIWEGEDYVPHVWSEWLQDPRGLLAVALYGGVIAGLGKLTKLSNTDWWFEGLRVHPDYQGKGIASHLDNYLFNYWLRTGSGFLRLVTKSNRESITHLSYKKGFHLVGELTTYKASSGISTAEHETISSFKPLLVEEINEAVELLCDSTKDWLPFGLMDLGWQWAPPNAHHLERFVKEDQAWWWRERQGLLIMIPKNDATNNESRIRMLACNDVDLADLLEDARNMAGIVGYDQVSWFAPLRSYMESALSMAGFQRFWEGSLVIFEKQHPQK